MNRIDKQGKRRKLNIAYIYKYKLRYFCNACGVTLPFLSYGGSSLLVSMTSIGIILNISKNNTT